MNTKLASILVLFFVLFSSFALGIPTPTVTIAPSSPKAGEDLTCAVNGLTSGYLFLWNIDGTVVKGNPLSGSQVHAGSTITCEVQRRSIFGTVVIGSASVVVATNHQPTITITQPQTGDRVFLNTPVSFLAHVSDADNDSLTVAWDFGDGGHDVGLNPQHTYTTQTIGPTTVTATVTDSHGSTSQASIQLSLLTKSFTVQVDTFADTQFSVKQDAFFRGDSLFVKFSVANRQGTPLPALNAQAYFFNPITGLGRTDLVPFSGTVGGKIITKGETTPGDGVYYYTAPALPLTDDVLGKNLVIVVSFQMNQGGQGQKEITINNNPPTLDAFPPITFQATKKFQLNLNNFVHDRETPLNDIEWTVSGNRNIHVQFDRDPTGIRIAVFTSQVAISERITLTANDGDNGTASRTIVVLATGSNGTNQPPIASFTIGKNPLPAFEPVVLNGSLSFDPDGAIVDYTWDFGDTTPAISGLQSSVQHDYTEGGNYTVTLYVTDNSGARSQEQHVITIIPASRPQSPEKIYISNYRTLIDFHRIQVVRIQPFPQQTSFQKGQPVQLFASLRNTGNVDEEVLLRFSVLNTPISKTLPFHLERNSERWTSGLSFTVPSTVQSGAYVGKLEVVSTTGAEHVLGYWPLIVQ